MLACLGQVCTRNPGGPKAKDSPLKIALQTFWNQTFSHIYPINIDMKGKSRMKLMVAEEMCKAILTDCKTHFESRIFKYAMVLLGAPEREARNL